MVSDITIGQYFPGSSIIHRLDARAKIIYVLALIVSFFVCKNFLSLILATAFVFIIVAISKTPFGTKLKSIKPHTIIIVITAI